jgi:hypothetical protein
MRTDLRELAELAKLPAPDPPASSSAAPGFATADSSGFVDLSAFSTADDGAGLDGWVERELARAGGKTKAGTVLSAGSMAPVAMASLLGPEPASADARPRKRGWVYTTLGIVGVAAVAGLAVILARHAPHSGGTRPQPVLASPAVASAVAPPGAAVTTAAAADTAPAAVDSSPPPAMTVAPPAPTSSPKKHTATRWHGIPAAAAVAPPAAVAARPATTPAPAKVSIPAAKSGGGGGDSLMDMMRASINSKKIL